MRERFLLSGEAGVGKTKALFSIIQAVAKDDETSVFFMDCDGGAVRFLKRSECLGERFNYYLTPDWMSLRDSYRDIRKKWKIGDWLMIDRADLVWEAVQNYFNAAVRQTPEEELDQLVLEGRIGKRRTAEELLASTSEEDQKLGRRMKNTPVAADMMTQPDWGPIKNAYNSIVYDAYSGRDPMIKHISVVATVLARPREELYVPPEARNKQDNRVLSTYSVVVQGEKNITSQPDSHLLLRLEQSGYTFSTVKERERKYVRSVLIPEEVGFIEAYQDAVGVGVFE